MELNYTKVGDYLLPDLTIKSEFEGTINKYGLLRLDYLKNKKQGLYTTLLMKNELQNHLFSVSIEVENRLNILMENYKKNDELLSEKNKEINPIEWTKLMNNYKSCAEEIILKELVYL